MMRTNLVTTVILVAIFALLSACGGGGGSEVSSSNNKSADVESVIQVLEIHPGKLVYHPSILNGKMVHLAYGEAVEMDPNDVEEAYYNDGVVGFHSVDPKKGTKLAFDPANPIITVSKPAYSLSGGIITFVRKSDHKEVSIITDTNRLKLIVDVGMFAAINPANKLIQFGLISDLPPVAAIDPSVPAVQEPVTPPANPVTPPAVVTPPVVVSPPTNPVTPPAIVTPPVVTPPVVVIPPANPVTPPIVTNPPVPPAPIAEPLHQFSVVGNVATIKFAMVNGFITNLSDETGATFLKLEDLAIVAWNGDVASWSLDANGQFAAKQIGSTTSFAVPEHDNGIVRLVSKAGKVYSIITPKTTLAAGISLDQRQLMSF